MASPADDPLLTHNEAAAYIRTPERTLYQLNWRGTGPRRIKRGRAVLYRLSDLDAWVELLAVEPTKR